MNKSGHSERPADGALPVLRWVLSRGQDAITCQVTAHSNQRTFDVGVLPHWDVQSGAIHVVAGPSQALTLHARIASRLRDSGWRIVRRFF